ncbi:3-oxoacyl-[acyl-carrier-protein] synthase 2 [compost metagenome]|uniref:beta-ketoacyl-ACP synthase II n=1 Tax=Pedobacter sp. ok626 TaxID=1761882 RepID=UPI000882F5CC|nr:beta-ketoacyl-ACP synthase II [Pedobacter sp. ok626]SDK82526.1 3-oxoacyl-[acyl-carrier-protein] synthase II [Pedobacter sp. ok626]
MELKRVVVTGLGALTPIGNTVPEFWDGLLNGVSGAGPITSFDTSKFKTKFACELKNFNPEDFMDRKEARKLDPFVQYAIVSTDEAVKDGNFDFSQLDTNRIGVIWGSGIGGFKTFQEEMRNFFLGDGTPRINPFFIPKVIIDIVPGHISIKYGLRGPNFATVSACASATNAMIDAYNYIRLNMCDVVISGGSEAIINEAGIGGFNAMHALSTRNDDPATASRPFDLDRDGFVAGEGAGTIILEELEHAKKRGAKIYAELVGGGMSADANHITAPHPQGLGARMVMTNALNDAGLTTADIDYINVHGTSTPLGDISESRAIVDLFGEDAYKLNISSTKSMTGHLLGAAGAVEAIATILAVQNDIVPPTINHFNDDPECDPKLNFTFNKAQKRTIRAAQSNTFGFGGHNASVIFKKYEE